MSALEGMAGVWWLRYLFGACMLAGAAWLASSGIPNAEHGVLAFGIVGAYCLRELFGWLLGALVVAVILYAIIGALAMLPLGVAIIAGAVILAGSKD